MTCDIISGKSGRFRFREKPRNREELMQSKRRISSERSIESGLANRFFVNHDCTHF